MPFLLIGLLIGVPAGAIGGIVGYFWLIAEADKQGARAATEENLKRQKEQAEQEAYDHWKKMNY